MISAAALYTASDVREMDRRAIEEYGFPGYRLMQRAAGSALLALRQRWPEARRLHVLCGAGNNAGDGYALAALAQALGYSVSLCALVAPETLCGDARRAWQAATDVGLSVEAWSGRLPTEVDVLVDALLGIGLDRPLRDAWAEVVQCMNAHPAPCLALDIPTGLDADRGFEWNEAVQAALTVTFIGLKAGLMTGTGPACCGALQWAKLDVPSAVSDGLKPVAHVHDPDLDMRWPAPRRADVHKGDLGHVLVIGGNHGMAGAVRLASEAAARSGAGLVSVATRPSHVATVLSGCPALMCRGIERVEDLDPLLARATVVVIGPGLGRDEWAECLWQRISSTWHGPLLVDADALNILAQNAQDFRTAVRVLTPHPGEAGRLLDTDTRVIQRDRYSAVAQIAQRYRAVCVLKGAGTLVHDGWQGYVQPTACAAMATAGMGDVLAGVIAALLAQGCPADVAARVGVSRHAQAALQAAAGRSSGVLAHDLLTCLE